MLRATHFAGFGGVGGSIVYWNPADSGSGLTLSNANRTVTGDGANWRTSRANRSVTSGKWYWEVRLDTMGGGDGAAVGIANASATLSNYTGADANGWSYGATSGNKFNSGSNSAYGATYAAGDVIGVKLDMGGGTVEFLKNNVSQGVAYSSLSGQIYPAICCFVNAVITGRFSPDQFSYPIPAGYSPLL